MNLTDRRVITSLLSRHGFSFSKALGQNFLIDPDVPRGIAAAAGAEDGDVLEVGPGIGCLTAELARVAKNVTAVELDRRLLPLLDETLAEFDNVSIVHGDILKTDTDSLFEGEYSVCANLPYYITTPIITKLFESAKRVKRITVMVQKELAERFCAAPGEKGCGAISALIFYYSEPRILFEVGRDSFIPAPNVDSAVLSLDIRKEPPVFPRDVERMFKTVHVAFSQRRKTLANCLISSVGLSREEAEQILFDCGIDKKARGEELSLETFAALSDRLEGIL